MDLESWIMGGGGVYVCSIQNHLLRPFHGKKKMYVWALPTGSSVVNRIWMREFQMMSYIESSQTPSQHEEFGTDGYF